MKILIIAPTPFFSDRGTPIRVYEHIRALRISGHEIRVITYAGGRDIPGIDIRRAPMPWRGEAFFIEAFWRRIMMDILMLLIVIWNKVRYRPDLTLCYLHSGFLMGYIASLFSSEKIIFDCHGILANEVMDKQIVKNRFLIRTLRLIEEWMYGVAKIITVPSEVVKNKILSVSPKNRDKITVIDDGVSSAIFEYSHDNDLLNNLRNKLGISPDKKVLIFTGFISAIAGVDILLKALRILNQTMENIILVVVGYPNEDYYRKIAEDMGIAKSVRFVGKVNYFDLPLYLDLADIAVAPRLSQAEGNSKILNYLAIGLPVVCFDIPINRELGGEHLIYPKKSTAEALAVSIRDAFVHLEKLHMEKGERILYVKKKYDWGAMASFINR